MTNRLTDRELKHLLRVAREEWSETDLARRAAEELADLRAAPPAPRETTIQTPKWDGRPDWLPAAAPPRESGGRLCARCKLGREGDPLNADFHCSTCYREMEMRARESGGGGFDKRAADALAREVQKLIDRKVIDSRSMAADALLDYVDPGPNESVPGKLGESGGGTGDALTWIERNEPDGIAIVARALAACPLPFPFKAGRSVDDIVNPKCVCGDGVHSHSHGEEECESCPCLRFRPALSPSPRQPTGEDRRERVVEAARVLDASARKHEEHGQNFPAFWIRDELDALRAALRSLSPAGDTNTSSPEGGTEGGKP